MLVHILMYMLHHHHCLRIPPHTHVTGFCRISLPRGINPGGPML